MSWSLSLFMGGTVLSVLALEFANPFAKSRLFNAGGHSEVLVWFLYSLSPLFILAATILMVYPLVTLKPDETQPVFSLPTKKSTIFMYTIIGVGVVAALLKGGGGVSVQK